MLDLFELQKDITLGKKIIAVPKEAENSDLQAIARCIKGGKGIALDLSETKIKRIEAAFSGCKALKAIVLPKGLESIGNLAFSGCKALKSILIPEGITSIGDEAFGGCWGLADKDGFVIVRGILFDYIGDAHSVVIPEGVTSIGLSAFDGYAPLTQVTIPASVTGIGVHPFCRCSALATIDVASENKNYSSVDGVLFSKDKKTLVCFPQGKGTDYYEIPQGVTTIDFVAFSVCKALTKVTIPESVTCIEDMAFEFCSSLMQVMIPASVTSIGNQAFEGCDNLSPASIKFADTSGWYFDKGFTQPAGADELASSLKDGKALYKKTR